MTACSPEIVATRQKLLLRVPSGLRVAEIGVWAGDFAADILQYADPAELHLIDPWEGLIACGDQDGNNTQWREGEELLGSVIRRFVHDDRVHLHRGRSDAVLATFPDGYFDFIYIDGEHEEPAVACDLAWAAQKCSGLIGGHDYAPQFPGVIAAVDLFCFVHGYRMTHLTQDGCPSFLLERA